MTDIKKLRTKLEQLEAQKQNIKNQLTKSNRHNATSRKIEIGVHLLKLAETDAAVYASLAKVWAVAKEKRPNAFINIGLPQAPTSETKYS